ncbi:MAG: hypothetical protein B7X86_01070 [Sphingobacteriales bacterium 17-39-43]|nr:MAG: hypothetical protein B7Y24_01075 [Sphingobacteriales bacterium 16-39-50]OZA26368.1 MAG: hypothetical protein B7X86_01070 [Sphingobacteriales bacterium 17-39-43]
MVIFIFLSFIFSFPSAEKKQNAAAAPDAIKVNTKAWFVHTAPAEAEKKLTEILYLGLSL